MKLKQLNITAFGPYAQRQIIDFSDFESAGIFLLTGPTGAGKTAIFDAVLFALYGDSSTGDRASESLRCQNAADDLLTEVVLGFELRGAEYQITRSPKQMRPKSRGEGFTEHRGEAVVVIGLSPDKPIVGIKEVNDFVQDLIGVNASQFRQLVLIPQGAFRTFLVSQSKDKEEILKNLFDVGIYDQLTAQLVEQSGRLRRQLGDIQLQMKVVVEPLKDQNIPAVDLLLADEIPNYSQLLTQLQTQVIAFEADLERAKTEQQVAEAQYRAAIEHVQKAIHINEAIDQREKLTADMAALQVQSEQITKMRQAHQQHLQATPLIDLMSKCQTQRDDIAKYQTDCARIQVELQQLQDELVRLNEHAKLLVSPERAARREQIGERIHYLSNLIDDLTKRDQLRDQLTRIKKEINSENEQLSALDKQLSTIEQMRHKLLETNTHIQDTTAQAHRLKLAISTIDNKLKDLEKVQRNTKQWQQKNLEVDKLSANRDKQTTKWRTMHDAHLRLQRDELLNRAYQLSSQLEDGMPCMVCGSTTHPHKAHAVSAVSAEDVERSQNALQTQTSLKDSTTTALKLARQQQAQMAQSALDDYKHLSGEIDTLDSAAVLARLATAVDNNRAELLQNRLALDKGDEELHDLLAQQQSLEATIANEPNLRQKRETALMALSKQQQAHSDHSATCALLDEKLANFSNRAAIETQLASLQAEKADDQKQQQAVNAAIGQCNQAIASKQVSAKHLEEMLEKAETAHQTLDNQLKVGLKQMVVASEGELQSLAIEPSAYQKQLAQIKHYEQRYQSTSDRLRDLAVRDLPQIPLDLEHIKVQSEQARAARDSAGERLNQSQQRVKQHQQIIARLNSQLEQYQTISDDYGNYRHLADLVKGENNYKLSLGRYVLTRYMDQILLAGNQRLIALTDSRYRFVRLDQAEHGSRQAGLELAVFDSYTGGIRHVKTLSGGESFKASLALALGMSDMVESYAGGIQMDTLLIDEGFGTLDGESLEQAINTLIDLNKAGRTVGIISHVAELKQRIQAKIIVNPHVDGSTITQQNM